MHLEQTMKHEGIMTEAEMQAMFRASMYPFPYLKAECAMIMTNILCDDTWMCTSSLSKSIFGQTTKKGFQNAVREKKLELDNNGRLTYTRI